MVINWDRIRRIGTGSGIGSLALILANRLLLGNKSARSNILAGAIGAAAGGYLGHRYDTAAARSKAREKAAVREESYSPEYVSYRRQQADVRSPVYQELVKVDSSNLSDAEKNKLKKDILSKAVLPGSSIVPLNPAEFSYAEWIRGKYANPKAVAASIKTETINEDGALNPKAVAADYAYLNSFGKLNMTPDQFKAVRYYHKLCSDVYRDLAAKAKTNNVSSVDASYAIENPALIDYIAYTSMPESLQRNIPVSHRTMFASRAASSKGAAYYTDRMMFNDPVSTKEKFKWYERIRTADTAAKTATEAAMYVGAGAYAPLTAHPIATNFIIYPLAGDVSNKAFKYILPELNSVDALEVGNAFEPADMQGTSFTDKAKYNRLANDVTALMWSPSRMPQYPSFTPKSDAKEYDKWRDFANQAVFYSMLGSASLNKGSKLGATMFGAVPPVRFYTDKANENRGRSYVASFEQQQLNTPWVGF